MSIRIALLALIVTAVAGCASGQQFTSEMGSLRISGNVAENVFAPQTRTLSLHLSDANTGRPLDASDVQVKAGNERVIHAVREKTGSYTADITDAQRVNLIIVQNGRTATLALQKQ